MLRSSSSLHQDQLLRYVVHKVYTGPAHYAVYCHKKLHNTFQKGVCDFNIPCGTLYLGNKSGDPVSRGTVIQDNVVGSISGGNGTFASDHNVWTSSSPGGTGDVRATPSYVGPLTSWAGYKLASGSPGFSGASDGGTVGIR